MTNYKFIGILVFSTILFISCDSKENADTNGEKATKPLAGQSGVKDDNSQKNIVKIAVGSKDHTTLVVAVKAAELVDALSNAGPFTVFAPINSAFDKLPKGTVDELLKPENKGKLTDILQHHVALAGYKESMLRDGQILGMVDGTNATITKKDGATFIDKAKIIGTVVASNGIVHVIDEVILPPAKK
jgi:uncharacterized surface protein with fasciclin (FAS1) repeats